ncbi:MAG: M48 family metallopeptidase [Rhodospirillales bacterium]|nr:M48 family metallopeptidase [Rhodospirillales bacterium]
MAIRYGGEVDLASQSVNIARSSVWSHLSSTGLEISHDVLPTVASVLDDCCDRLLLPPDGVRGFVYAAPEIQASCMPIDDQSCVIRLSSSLVEKFDDQELAFIIGHELGHFLLGHGLADEPERGTVEYFALSRAQELSCDRIGLVSARNPDAALRSIMKMTSGLSADYLRFDIAAYLRDTMRTVKAYTECNIAFATHPSMPVRTRCLLWFSQFAETHYPRFDSKEAQTDFEVLDHRVRSDVTRYVEKPVTSMIETTRRRVSSWIWLAAAVSDGKLSRREQDTLTEKFGADFVNKARRNFTGLSSDDVRLFVCERARAEIGELLTMAPSTSKTFVDDEINASEIEFLPEGMKSVVR